jgi:hypothetical protein
MDEDGSCFGRVRKAKKTVPGQPRAEKIAPWKLKASFAFETEETL